MTDSGLLARAALRRRLLAERERFAGHPRFGGATESLAQRLASVLHPLQPQCLGLYWPVRGEFNAPAVWRDDAVLATVPAALPFARLAGRQMHYRRWDGSAPCVVDECGIPTSDGEAVVPDVALVPCVGFTVGGLRLGYGGGYCDRWVDAHRHVVTVGVAWSCGRIDTARFSAEPHDRKLGFVVTECEVICLGEGSRPLGLR